MPLTETGFKKRTFNEIVTDKAAKAKELFGEDIETSELTPLGKYNHINAYDQAIAEEEIEDVYWSIFPNYAKGTTLDHLCKNFAGIQRNPATKAQFIVTFAGVADAIVEKGFLVGTESGINFETKEDIIIDESGTIDATVECVESGAIGNVLLQEIKVIVNSSADVNSVIGKSLVAKGEETESDFELRQRFNEAKEGLGSCNEAAIKSALLRVPTVTHASVITNEENGSFECFVDGGNNYHKEIAEAIYEKKSIGIKTTGTIAQEIIDKSGEKRIINFSHTTTAPVYVRVAIVTTSAFEGAKGKQDIKNNLETFIDSVGIGNPVILSSLYGEIHKVTGVKKVDVLELSTDGNAWNTADINVSEYENCVCMEVRIKNNNDSDYEVIS